MVALIKCQSLSIPSPTYYNISTVDEFDSIDLSGVIDV